MCSFDVLGVPYFSNPEKIEKTYSRKVADLENQRNNFSEQLYNRKIIELQKAKEECLAFITSEPIERVKKYSKEKIEFYKNPNVLHYTTCCIGECFFSFVIIPLFVGSVIMFIIDKKNRIKEDPKLYNEMLESTRKYYKENRYGKLALFGFGKTESEIDIEIQKIVYEEFVKKLDEKKKLEEEQRQKQLALERLETERRIQIQEKTKVIREKNKHTDDDYIRWTELNKQSSCNIHKITWCHNFLSLFEKCDSNSVPTVKSIEELMAPHQKIAVEKQEITNRVEEVAQLYAEIGNTNEADKLRARFGL